MTMDNLARRQRKIEEEAGRGKVDYAGIVGKLTREQMLQSIHGMLHDTCYELLPLSRIGTVAPDFYAERKADARTYQVVGVMCMGPDDVPPAYEKLAELERALGDRAEYAMAVHQMPEYLLYDMLEADKGRLYINMKERMYMMWICYRSVAGDTSTWCFLGGSRDKMLEDRFSTIRQLTAEAIVGPRVTDMLMEEEASEF